MDCSLLICFILDWTFELFPVICSYGRFPVCILASKSLGYVPDSSMLTGEVSTSFIQTGTLESPGRHSEPFLGSRIHWVVLGTLPWLGCLPVALIHSIWEGCSPCHHRWPVRANHFFAGTCHRQALLVAGLVSLSWITRGK